ncbi:hypothetical protein BJ742DRAFT_39923 [Cladochytrium replicatum]|nr:hypothetical protein BJ742DRAFT_39923 [Cladochytrium replicatum]
MASLSDSAETAVEILLDHVPAPDPSDGTTAYHPSQRLQSSYDELNRRYHAIAPSTTILEKLGKELQAVYEQNPQYIPEQALRDAGWTGTDRSKVAARFVHKAKCRALPAGYAFFQHLKFAERPPSIGSEPSNTSRTDNYLFGHPMGKRYRSVPDFIPHLRWMAVTPSLDRSLCPCRNCNGGGIPRDHTQIRVRHSLPAGTIVSAEANPVDPGAITAQVSASAPTTPHQAQRTKKSGSSASAKRQKVLQFHNPTEDDVADVDTVESTSAVAQRVVQGDGGGQSRTMAVDPSANQTEVSAITVDPSANQTGVSAITPQSGSDVDKLDPKPFQPPTVTRSPVRPAPAELSPRKRPSSPRGDGNRSKKRRANHFRFTDYSSKLTGIDPPPPPPEVGESTLLITDYTSKLVASNPVTTNNSSIADSANNTFANAVSSALAHPEEVDLTLHITDFASKLAGSNAVVSNNASQTATNRTLANASGVTISYTAVSSTAVSERSDPAPLQDGDAARLVDHTPTFGAVSAIAGNNTSRARNAIAHASGTAVSQAAANHQSISVPVARSFMNALLPEQNQNRPQLHMSAHTAPQIEQRQMSATTPVETTQKSEGKKREPETNLIVYSRPHFLPANNQGVASQVEHPGLPIQCSIPNIPLPSYSHTPTSLNVGKSTTLIRIPTQNFREGDIVWVPCCLEGYPRVPGLTFKDPLGWFLENKRTLHYTYDPETRTTIANMGVFHDGMIRWPGIISGSLTPQTTEKKTIWSAPLVVCRAETKHKPTVEFMTSHTFNLQDVDSNMNAKNQKQHANNATGASASKFVNSYAVDILPLSFKVTTNLPDMDIEPYAAYEPHELLHWGLVNDSRPWQNVALEHGVRLKFPPTAETNFPMSEVLAKRIEMMKGHLDKLGDVQLAKYFGSLSSTVRRARSVELLHPLFKDGSWPVGQTVDLQRFRWGPDMIELGDVVRVDRKGVERIFEMQGTPTNVDEYYARFDRLLSDLSRQGKLQGLRSEEIMSIVEKELAIAHAADHPKLADIVRHNLKMLLANRIEMQRRARAELAFKAAEQEHSRVYGNQPPVPFREPDQELIFLTGIRVTLSSANGIAPNSGQALTDHDLRLSVELTGKLLRVVVLPQASSGTAVSFGPDDVITRMPIPERVPLYKSFEPTADPCVFANEPQWVAYNLTDAVERASWSKQSVGFCGYVVCVVDLERDTVRVSLENMCGRFRPMFADVDDSIRLKSAVITASTGSAV